MAGKGLILFCFIFCYSLVISIGVLAQGLTVSPNINAQQLAETLAGPGVVVQNAQLVGSAAAPNNFPSTGTFTTNGGFSFNSGIILSSSSIIDIPGNPGSQLNVGTCSNCDDADLEILSGNTILDAVSLEFDVIPSADTLTFRYIFASEEYPNFVCCTVNDAFGFFVSGPGISGPFSDNSINIALIPGTNLPVSINTVNNGAVGPTCQSNNCDLSNTQFFQFNNTPNSVKFNGNTIVFTATVAVQRCETYRFKLKIGDAGDNIYDSGVFLEAGSLSSKGVELEASSDVGASFKNIVEGCLNGVVTVKRTRNSKDSILVDLLISGTAINGVDYQMIPSSVLLPTGKDSINIPIIPIQDNIVEGFETIKIAITETCNNIIAVDSVELIIQDFLITSISGPPYVCFGSSGTLSSSGGANYLWSPAGSLDNPMKKDPIATPVATTTYTVQISAGLCVAEENITLLVRPLPDIIAGPDTTICFNTNVNLFSHSLTADKYKWSPSTFLSSDTIPNPTAIAVLPMNYVLKVTDQYDCVNRDTVSISINNNVPAVILSAPVTICEGTSTQLNASGGISYEWSPAAGLNNPNIPDPVASLTLTTTYTVRVYNSAGCYADKSVKITVVPKPNASAGPDKSFCEGINTQLLATGGTSFQWTPVTGLSNPNTNNPIATPASTTVYTVTVTNSGGCSATDDVTVTVTHEKFITTSGDTTICTGVSVPLSAKGAKSYSWTPSQGLNNSNIASPTATVNTTTTFTVSGYNSMGCFDKDSVTVSIGAPGNNAVTPADTIICYGSSLQLLASGGINYKWSPAAGLSSTTVNNPVATPLSDTKYVVTTTFANGCVTTDTINIKVNNLPVASAGQDKTICKGASAALNASGGVNYKWSPAIHLSDPNISDPVATPVITTIYTVSVFNSAGCVDTDEVTVVVNPGPSTDAGPDQTICHSGSVQLSGSGGNAFSWSPTTGLSDPTISNPIASPAATTIYVLTSTDNNGCSANDSVTVSINSLPNINVSADKMICVGDTTELLATGGNTFLWSPINGLNDPTISNPVANPASTTTYTVTIFNINNCSATDSVKVTVIQPMEVTAAADKEICKGASATISATGTTTYSWNPVIGLINPNDSITIAAPSATTVYTVIGTDKNGCKSIDSLIVKVNALPAITLSVNDTTICVNSDLHLSATGGSSYKWEPPIYLNNTNISDPIVSPEAPVTYTLTVKDNNGCENIDSVTVGLHPVILSEVSPQNSQICEGDSVTLKAINGVQYSWLPVDGLDDPFSASPVAKPSISTEYKVTITDQNGCIPASVAVFIEVSPPAIADAGPDQVLVIGQSIVIPGVANGSVLWTPSIWLSDNTIPNPTLFAEKDIIYVMEVETIDGCNKTDTLNVHVKDVSKLFIPTAFSPNNDGVNDVYILTGLNDLELISLSIYNRWGQLIFSTNDINQGWDGKHNGQDVEIGSYLYKLYARGSKGEFFERAGTITLIR